MRRPPAFRQLLFAGVFALCGGGALVAQEEAAPRPALDTFDDQARVIEVQVPVNVYARNGEPVRGLTAEDFQVLDEGKVQELTNFRVVDLATIEPSPDRVMDIEYDVPPAARRHFLLLFDLSFSPPTSLARARQAAQEFVLENMHPADLAAVAVHTVEGGTQLLVTFTPDRTQLARAITTMGNPRLLKLATRDPLRFMIDSPDSGQTQSARDVGGVSDGVASLENSVSAYLQVIGKQMAKMEKSYARGQITSWSHSMKEMARLLDSVEGRKHVVLFSEGFDGRLLLGRQPDFFDEEMQDELRAVEDGQYFMVDTDDRYGNTQLQVQVALMLDEFRKANCTIQAVDISGLRADLPSEDRARRVGRDALFYIANETGGRLYEDANDFGEELAEVLDSSTVTYLLSFKPTELGDAGDHRRLKVKVNAPRGSQVSHRMGYFVPRPFDELHPMEKSLLASDLIASAAGKEDLDVDVLAAPFRANEEQAYVPVIIEVGGEGLLAGLENDLLPVELYTYVTNDKGEMRDFFTQMVSFDLSEGNRRSMFAETGLKYYGHVDLTPGDYLLRVLVRNAVTGATTVRTKEMTVPLYELGEPQLLPPFFLEDTGSWFLVREQDDAYQSTTVYPFTVNGEPYIPAAYPGIGSESMSELCLVAYNLGKGQIDLESRVLAEDGTVVSENPLDFRERTVTGIDGLDKLYATLESDSLATGHYTLEVAVTDPATKTRHTNSIPLRVDP